MDIHCDFLYARSDLIYVEPQSAYSRRSRRARGQGTLHPRSAITPSTTLTHSFHSGTLCSRYGTARTCRFLSTLTLRSVIGNHTCHEAWWRLRSSSAFLLRNIYIRRSDIPSSCGRKTCTSRAAAGARACTSSSPLSRCVLQLRPTPTRRTRLSRRGHLPRRLGCGRSGRL